MEQDNVLVVSVRDERSAAEVRRVLEELAGQGRLELHAAAIAHRGADGTVQLSDEAGPELSWPERHGRLTAVLTVLVAPIDTLLLGNTLTAAVGAATPTPAELDLQQLARSIPPEHTAVVADVTESDPVLLDRRTAELGASLTRRPFAALLAEPDEPDEPADRDASGSID